MKIAFDGTVLHGRKSGVGYYCEELLKAMLEMNHADEFFVFSHQQLALKFPSSNGNLQFSNSTFFPIRAVYLHAILPGILDKAQPDLCHYTNFLAPVMDDRPYVVTIHDMGLEVLKNAHPMAKRLYTRRLVPRVARKAKLILANSEYSKWQIVKYLGLPEDRIRVTPLAASPEFRPVGVRPENPYFLYVGNLEPRKNLERLVEAFARMPGKDHDLVIVGNRWFRGDDVERKAKSLGLNGRVKFKGYVPRAELPALYSGASAFVYPSLLEGFGLPVIEAMACGTPVMTSNNSALREVSGNAAVLVDPLSVREMTETMTRLAEDAGERQELSRRGLERAAEFSWRKTAELTIEAYREALSHRERAGAPKGEPDRAKHQERRRVRADTRNAPIPALTRPSARPLPVGEGSLIGAISKTINYSNLFQYPLTSSELRERLFDIKVDELTFHRVLKSLNVTPSAEALRLRASRELISDQAIRSTQPHLRTLASLPFVRMLAFSGATAHRNMTGPDDIDLFMIVEDGKLWAVFLIAMVWAKLRGLRRRLCLNYAISDAALPLFDDDAFTAQQVASLKPIYGKSVYDRFLAMNPFVRRRFPNFDPARHRELHPEITAKSWKGIGEALLRFGPIQIAERVSRAVLGRYLKGKIGETSDVLLDSRRLKLHLRSHKNAILSETHLLESVRSSRESGS